MNTQLIETLRSTIHLSSLVLIVVTIAIILIGLIRPQLFRVILREFSQRKYIVTMGVFVCLLSATTVVATQPASTNRDSTSHAPPAAAVALTIADTKTPVFATSIDEVSVLEVIASGSQTQDDPALPIGQTKVVQAGKAGEKKLAYNVTRVGGKETSRVLKSEIVVLPPTPEIVAVGSQAPPTANKNQAQSRHNKSSVECKNVEVNGKRMPICLPKF